MGFLDWVSPSLRERLDEREDDRQARQRMAVQQRREAEADLRYTPPQRAIEAPARPMPQDFDATPASAVSLRERMLAESPEAGRAGLRPYWDPESPGFFDAAITPLAPKGITDRAARILGQAARFGVEHVAGGNIGLASRATGFNPSLEVAGERFSPLRSGVLPERAGVEVQQAVEEEGQRILPPLTSPVGLASTIAFPAATAYGTAAAAAGGIGGRLAERAGFDPRLRLDLPVIGETNIGPRAAGELLGGAYGGPGRNVRVSAPSFDTEAAGVVARNTLSDFGQAVPEPVSEARLLTNTERSAVKGGLDELSKKWTANGVRNRVHLSEDLAYPERGPYIFLDDIQVPAGQRGGGLGTAYMDDLTSLADREGLRIYLRAARGGPRGAVNAPTPWTRLQRFYKRAGFKANRDDSISANMWRAPRGDLAEPATTPRTGMKAQADAIQDALGFGDKQRLRDLGIDAQAIDDPAVLADIRARAPDIAAKIEAMGTPPPAGVQSGRGLADAERGLDLAPAPTEPHLGVGDSGTPPPPETPPTTVAHEPPTPPEGTWETAIEKLKRGLKESARRIAPSEVTRTLERRERLAAYKSILAQRLKEGVPSEDALREAKAALRGEYNKPLAAEFSLTDVENEALWRRVADHDYQGKGFQQITASEALTRVASGEPLRRFEIKVLREVYGDEFGKALERAAGHTSAWDKLANSITIPRTLLSSFDLSYPFRQGWKAAGRHPREFFGNIWPMVKAYRSEGAAEAIEQAIKADPLVVPVGARAGGKSMTWGEVVDSIDILRPLPGADDASFLAREEGFLSKWAEKIPGVQASARAFITYGNKLRNDIAKYWVQKWIKEGTEITPKRLEDVGRLLNRLTGRGTLGDNVLANTIQALGWAPKYRASGPQFFMQMLHRDPKIRGIAIQQAVSTLALGTSILTLAKVSGAADVELDPRSSDFGKMRFGDFRLNIWGTDQVLFRTMAQSLTGERKSDTGEIQDVSPGPALGRYLRSGLAPENALLLDVGRGENYIGQPINSDLATLKREAMERAIPLSIQDIRTTWQQEGPLAALAAAPAILMGASTSAYDPSGSKQLRDRFQEITGREYNAESPADRKTVADTPELAALKEASRQSSIERGFEGAIASEKTRERIAQAEIDRGLTEQAKRGLAGDSAAGEQWSRNRGDFLTWRAGIYEQLYADSDFGPAASEIGKLVEKYRTVKPQMDPVTSEYDFDAFNAERDRIKQQMRDAGYGTDADELDASDKFLDPDASAFDRQYQEARDLRDEAPAKYRGTSVEAGRRLDEFVRDVDETQQKLQDDLGYPVLKRNVAAALADQRGTPALARQWERLQGKKKNEAINPGYDRWLAKNRDTLEPFFDWLYNRSFEERMGEYSSESPFDRTRPTRPQRPSRPTRAEVYRDQQEQDVIERELVGAGSR